MTPEQQKEFEELCARLCLSEDQQFELTEFLDRIDVGNVAA